MADPTTLPTATLPTASTTPEALVADREKFWKSFTSATTFAAIAIALLLALMGIFLV